MCIFYSHASSLARLLSVWKTLTYHQYKHFPSIPLVHVDYGRKRHALHDDNENESKCSHLQAHRYDVNNNNSCFSMLSQQTTATTLHHPRKTTTWPIFPYSSPFFSSFRSIDSWYTRSIYVNKTTTVRLWSWWRVFTISKYFLRNRLTLMIGFKFEMVYLTF